MKKWWVFVLLVSIAFGLQAAAQNDTMTLDEAMRSAEDWAKENLDDDALRVLKSVDQEKVKQFLAEVQKEFHGEYVVDLASLKEGARTILPLLESYEETQPYAVWLKTRLDYLDVADQFRLSIPPPKTEPGQPPKPIPNPTPQREREVWVKKLSEEPLPRSANAYVSAMKLVFIEQKVPPELVWIAEVESSFDPRARSPVGAAGLFQLMPATAKRYGLRTGWMDQRLRVVPSAEAAAKYLRALHKHYGDWRLAVAAYNCGEGTVDGLLKKSKTRSFDAIATRLPAETQLYVPKVEATLMQREGVRLEELRSAG
jgi:membrane-bound lytic murein transglycosylase D